MKLVSKAIKIDPELWHNARVKAMAERMTLQELIAKLLTEYFKKKGGVIVCRFWRNVPFAEPGNQ